MFRQTIIPQHFDFVIYSSVAEPKRFIFDSTEFVTRTVDEGNNMDIVFLDFAKAFEKVPKEHLLTHME